MVFSVCVIQHVVEENGKLDCVLKSESIQTAAAAELQDEWKLSTEGMIRKCLMLYRKLGGYFYSTY